MFGFSPNIIGTIDAEGPSAGIADGAFYRKQESAIHTYPNQSYGSGDYVGFDASLCSTVYSGNDLQPKAIQALVCIKF